MVGELLGFQGLGLRDQGLGSGPKVRKLEVHKSTVRAYEMNVNIMAPP